MNEFWPQQLAAWVLETKDPQATAVICAEEVCSYQQLADGARSLAAALPALSAENPRCVLIMKKSIAALQATIGVLSLGGCYVPLDAAYPAERLKPILATLQPAAVVVDAQTEALVKPLAAELGLPLVNMAEQSPCWTASKPPIQQPLAAILHTSGSTGQPKSVHIDAAQIYAFTDWVVDTFMPAPGERLLNHAPLAFDLTFLDLFAMFRCGATLLLTQENEASSGARLSQLCQQLQATHWHSTPTSLRLLLAHDPQARYPAMRTVLFAGEPMPGELLTQLMALFPNAEFYNIYGSSETNDTFCYHCPKTPIVGTVPLGYPLAYTEWLLLDEHQQPVTTQREGELWVHCPTLMAGYGEQALNRQVFRQFAGKRFFCTRDRVRIDDSGLFHFLGRSDWIVKLNGFRVDLLDVEQNALRCGWLDEAVAFVAERDGERQLEMAVYGAAAQSMLQLRQHLVCYLPPYALPRRYHLYTEPLAKNSNGKLCRRSVERQINEMQTISS
ncbi:AMP-binding protein [Raoultella ornithinolytica]|uniref:AMP-binding protein n=1 Tax=Raoultella ornithinolytica TaxID=54291 RepID=UPI00358F58CE